ncbi:MAG: hypothetical protein QGF59_04880 [Pirellulaceae bacterium]|jgi:hypothetical protein|nr:hypothetical protein [Pirellulaceae bacterium]
MAAPKESTTNIELDCAHVEIEIAIVMADKADTNNTNPVASLPR